MTPREEFKFCFGVARSRIWAEDGPPQYSGMPKRLIPALEKALYAYDELGRREPGRVLRILKEKRDPFSFRNTPMINCRCSVVPITLFDPTKSPD